MDNINILCSLNDAYVKPMLVMLNSMQKHNQEKKNLYIFSTSLSEDSEKKIRDFLTDKNFEIKIYRLNFKNISRYKFMSNDIFLRIFAFHYLPEEVKKVLYLDADAVFLGDVRKIYDTNLDGKLMAAVMDVGNGNLLLANYFKKLKLDHKYFNAGVILMNLKEIRKRWNADDVMKYIEEHNSKFRFQDQDVLNTLCKDSDLVLLERGCNYQIKKANKVKDVDKIVFLHFLSRPKPWQHCRLNKKEELFWKDWERDDLFHKMTKEDKRKKK